METWNFLVFLILLWYGFRFVYKPNKSKKVLVVLGSGGHTSEMLTYMKRFDFDSVDSVDFVCSNDDKMSVEKFQLSFTNKARLHQIKRSRKVGQTYISSVFTTLYSFIPAFLLVWKLKPNLIITNGPGTALPICYSAYALKLLKIIHTKQVFIESFCRVRTLSLAGKLIYPITDIFYVQWEQLKQEYPKCRYIGILV